MTETYVRKKPIVSISLKQSTLEQLDKTKGILSRSVYMDLLLRQALGMSDAE